MIRYLFLLSALFFLSDLNAQFILPQFETPIKLEPLNSAAEESLPIPYQNGDKMYFVRTAVLGSLKEKSKGQEVWQAKREGGVWQSPTNQFDAVNDNGNNAIIGTSKDGNRVYVFNSVQTRRKLAKGIAMTEKNENGEWSELVKIEIPGFEIGDGLYSFYINPDENVILISMPVDTDTSDYEDLFISTKGGDGNWLPIVSLGSTINTPKSELSPYLADDNKTLYFSSTGHGGLGDADIFVTYRLDDSWVNWSNPLNMGAPINSPLFDAYFIIGNNEEVYFTSNRGQIFSDIYYTKLTKEVRFIGDGEVINGKFIYKGLPVEGLTLNVYDENNLLIDQVVTDENGLFSYVKLNPDESYIIRLSEEDAQKYDGAKIYLLDESENLKKRLHYLSTEKSFLEEEPLVQKDEMIVGVFEYNNLPRANTGLVLFNEKGEPLDTIYTNEKGQFTYNKIKFDQAYSMRPIDMTDEEIASSSIYIDGKKRQKMSTLSADKNSLLLKDVSDDTEILKGVFQYKQLPLANAGLVIWDENGFPVDTIYTDDKGNFTYEKIKTDIIYSLRPLDMTPEEMDDAVIYLLDDEDKIVGVSDKDNENPFLMVPYTEGDEVIYTPAKGIEKMTENQPIPASKIAPEKTNTLAPATEKAVAKKLEQKDEKTLPSINQENKGNYTLDYPFNQFYLGKDDKQILLKVIALMKKDPSLKVRLIGHTDNVGRDEVNQEVSEQRAEVAKKFMTDRNISPDRITTEGMADRQPVATNETKIGRAENRRVEIKF